MDESGRFLDQHKLPLLLCLVGIVLIVGGIVTSNLTSKPKAAASFPKESIVKQAAPAGVKIDVSGAVSNPGVYPMEADSRVEDAIKKAGGFSEKANSEFISKYLNLSQKISDGQKIYVPFEGEQAGGVVAGVSQTVKVGINTGSLVQLDSLPGVGSVTAQKIVDGRPFNALDDLLTKKIVSKTVFDKIKDQIDLN